LLLLYLHRVIAPVTIMIPRGYRSDVLIIEDASAPRPGRTWRGLTYVVPPSGVVRTSHVDVLGNYAINPRLVCREADGTIVEGCTISGPYYDQLDEWSRHGIPADYVVPHEDR
jgi:hypothetical protein